MEKNVSKVLSLLMSLVMLVGILSVPMTITAAEPVQLSLGSAKGAAGDIVTIPFTISANSAAVIGSFKLSYDINRLEYLDSEYGDLLLDDDCDHKEVIPSVATSSIAFAFRYGVSTGITGEGALFTFRFKIKSDLTAPVNLTLDFGTLANALLRWDKTAIPHVFNNGTVSPLGYAITFDFNDGTAPITVWVNEGEQPTPPDHTRVGYTLNRWSPGFFVAAQEDATYTAYWSAHNYSVIYAGNGNDGPSTASSSHTYNQEKALALNEFTKTGYNFVGWNTKQDGTGTPYADGQIVKNLSAEQGGNFKLYAQWATNSFDLTYDANGGTGGTGPIATEYGATLTAPTVTREGYTFMGWNPEVAATMPAADTTYTAQWKAKTYNITFNANGGEGSETQTVEHGTRPDAPVVAREGHTFNGWGVEIAPATADEIYTAQWTINQYTISFNSNGGTAVADITEDFATVISPPTDPIREGYIFNGWLPAVPATMPAADTTYTAQWTINSYTITWDADGGDGGGTNSCDYGATPTAIDAGTKTGHTFTGWDPAIVAATGDTTYTAQWTADEHTITFDLDGGTGGPSPITQDYGTQVTAPTPDPTKTGYTFTGWIPAVPQAMPDEDLECVAQWTINSYTITWDADGGDGGGTNSCDYGATPTAIDAGTKTGHTFTGWDPAIVAATGDTTYTAQWEAIESTIIFDAGDDVTPEDTTTPEKDTPTDEVPDTGSTIAGIAAFATLSMAAAAAFVLGKKKED